jgi:hypothetical protein
VQWTCSTGGVPSAAASGVCTCERECVRVFVIAFSELLQRTQVWVGEVVSGAFLCSLRLKCNPQHNPDSHTPHPLQTTATPSSPPKAAKQARGANPAEGEEGTNRAGGSRASCTLLPPPFDAIEHSLKESRAHAGFQTDPSEDSSGHDGIAWTVCSIALFLLDMCAPLVEFPSWNRACLTSMLTIEKYAVCAHHNKSSCTVCRCVCVSS